MNPTVGLGEFLRHRRLERHLTLRQVCDLMDERGERVPPSTLSRVEQGKLDPSVRRLFLLLDLYAIPLADVSALVRQGGALAFGVAAQSGSS
jgi:transcriptional regulator with XRE-family HTH domain